VLVQISVSVSVSVTMTVTSVHWAVSVSVATKFSQVVTTAVTVAGVQVGEVVLVVQ
jgi:hypothetical protein